MTIRQFLKWISDCWFFLLGVRSSGRIPVAGRTGEKLLLKKEAPFSQSAPFARVYWYTICIIECSYTEIWGFPFNMRIICRFYTYRSIPKCKL